MGFMLCDALGLAALLAIIVFAGRHPSPDRGDGFDNDMH